MILSYSKPNEVATPNRVAIYPELLCGHVIVPNKSKTIEVNKGASLLTQGTVAYGYYKGTYVAAGSQSDYLYTSGIGFSSANNKAISVILQYSNQGYTGFMAGLDDATSYHPALMLYNNGSDNYIQTATSNDLQSINKKKTVLYAISSVAASWIPGIGIFVSFNGEEVQFAAMTSATLNAAPTILRLGGSSGYFAASFQRAFTYNELRAFSADPYRIFISSEDLLPFLNVSSVVNGSASGAIPSSLTLISPTGVSIGGASLIAPFSDNLDFTVPTITGTGGASCSGNPSFLFLTAPTGSAIATGDATATGILAGLTMTPATASSTGSANIIGSLSDDLDFTPITGTAFSSVTASGSIDELNLTAPIGSASNETIGSGSLSELSFTNVLGNGFGSSSASGNIDELNFDSIIGTAIGNATGIGSLSFLSFTTITGSATGVNQHDAAASGSLSSLSLSPPNGHAAELAVIEDDSEYILVYSKGSGIRYVPVTPGARKILSSM